MITKLLGSGYSSIVYEVIEEGTTNYHAMKVLRSNIEEEKKERALNDFIKEADILT